MTNKKPTLKERREAAGLTQERLAQLAGVSSMTISRAERGKTQMSRLARKAVSEVLEQYQK